jgi:hypothetical protein
MTGISVFSQKKDEKLPYLSHKYVEKNKERKHRALRNVIHKKIINFSNTRTNSEI